VVLDEVEAFLKEKMMALMEVGYGKVNSWQANGYLTFFLISFNLNK
jgi:hypothetical protein